HTFALTARGPMEAGATAGAETVLEVLASPKLPVDVVFVLDITGSMRKTIEGINESLPKFDAELVKAQLDARFGLGGFQDTTLNQAIKTPLLNGPERMTADVGQLRAGIGRLKLGGGGAEGASSLDGLDTAADYPLRADTVRVFLLVTDDGPKR